MKWMIITIILLDHNYSMADALLDAIYGKYPANVEIVESIDCTCSSDSDEGEHYSWELGENDSIPETEIVENPYSEDI